MYHQILALARLWRATWIIVDATGVGAGLGSFLVQALGERVTPLVFTPKVKSDLGWGFVGICETGRYQDYADDQQPDTRQFWYEVEACQYEVREGPGQALKWGVWEATGYDGLVATGHDDLLIAASMTATIDQLEWTATGPSATVEHTDEIEEIDNAPW